MLGDASALISEFRCCGATEGGRCPGGFRGLRHLLVVTGELLLVGCRHVGLVDGQLPNCG